MQEFNCHQLSTVNNQYTYIYREKKTNYTIAKENKCLQFNESCKQNIN